LLSTIYADWLRSQGVDDEHIITIDLEDRRHRSLRDPDALLEHIDSKIKDRSVHYIMIDEIQHVNEFEDVLNSYLKMPNADVYVTGSNARFLSKDVITTFRGRGDEVKLYPLRFSEVYPHVDMLKDRALTEFMLYGGLPQVILKSSDEEKNEYLKTLFANTYLRDIVERYKIQDTELLDELLDILASGIGTLTNPTKLANAFESVKRMKVNRISLTSYLEYICDSFLVEKATRYDVKGKRYIDTPYKYYFVDCGLRNARLNFRQTEPSHLLENVIYNELRVRGFNVDVGVVPIRKRNEDGALKRSQLEVDFVCNLGSKRYYIQSAYRMLDEEKQKQEEASLLNIDDSFKKIIIVGEDIPVLRNEAGITTLGIYDFLLNDNSLDW
jgi:predicted AAA+ superfamily ATPase